MVFVGNLINERLVVRQANGHGAGRCGEQAVVVSPPVAEAEPITPERDSRNQHDIDVSRVDFRLAWRRLSNPTETGNQI